MQLFATRFSHLQYLEELIGQFEQHPLNQYICFTPVRYMPIDTLACTAETGKSIQCNEKSWKALAQSIDTRFIGALLPEGGANVHLGILYIDAADNFDVFVHEISHLLGFVDEYPLAAEHKACQSIQQQAFSENVAVLAEQYQGNRSEVRANILSQLAWGKHIKQTTPILQPIKNSSTSTQDKWRLGTPTKFQHEIGLFKGNTCQRSNQRQGDGSVGFSAYSPLNKTTKMQYFSLDFPSEYLHFLQTGSMKYLMPSFHYNIALAHFTSGNIKEADYWLKQSAKWEDKQYRREVILQGNF